MSVMQRMAMEKKFSILLILGVSACMAWISQKRQSVEKESAPYERLVQEASTFFEFDAAKKRVSEAKAISDLLTVARSAPTDVIKHILAETRKPELFSYALPDTLRVLQDFAFSVSSTLPEYNYMQSVRVIGGRIHLLRSPWRPEDRRHTGYSFGDEPYYRRRDLTPFISQIMSPSQYQSDKRTHGDLDAIPVSNAPDERVVAQLVDRMETARTLYRGPKGDNSPLVAELLAIARWRDTSAIVKAAEIFVSRHELSDFASEASDNATAGVIDPLENLLWGASKITPKDNSPFRCFVLVNGRLTLSPKFIYLSGDNREWISRQGVNEAYWQRRDLTAFASQAARQLPNQRGRGLRPRP